MSMLGSIVSAVTDPGSLVKDAVNSLLPKNLAVVGDIAGAVVDFQTGHGFQAAQHAFEALKDLPQAMNSAGKNNLSPPGSPAFEPSPPPLRQGQPSWRGTPTTPAHDTKALAPPQNQTPSGASGFASLLGQAIKLLQAALQGHAPAGATSTAAKPKPETVSTDTSSTKSSETKSSGAKPSETKSSETKSTSSAKPKETAEPSSSSKSSSTSSSKSSDGPLSLAKLNKMDDGAFMTAVRSGKIPDEVLDDPKAMMAIQQRMNHISEMTKLMTSMMQAMHDMQMSVIQNLRV